jgi:hypothetical protein
MRIENEARPPGRSRLTGLDVFAAARQRAGFVAEWIRCARG